LVAGDASETGESNVVKGLAEIGELVTKVVLKVILIRTLKTVSLTPSETVWNVFVADAVAESISIDATKTLALTVGLSAVLRNPRTDVVIR
jgi:hypothetical protein